jgi:hypothetical protein
MTMMASEPTGWTAATALRFDLEAVACCPDCRGSLRAAESIRDAAGLLYAGRLDCDACGVPSASVRHYRLDFLRPNAPPAVPAPAGGLEVRGERRVRAEGAQFGFYGPWGRAGTMMRANGDPGCAAVYEGCFSAASVRFLQDAWSGIVEVCCDALPPRRIDLFRPEGSFVTAFPVAEGLGEGLHRIVIRPTGERNPAAREAQVILDEIVTYGPVAKGFDPRPARNYGNPHSAWIQRHIDSLPAEAIILDIGGGDRRTANPRHINLEYLPYELADCFGDVHRLPFRDASFDFVCSQAVFEHVRNPFVAARELIRVLKPGGHILTEVAFLQPLHGVPHHYFNMTLDGVKALFEGCELLEEGWFGDFSQTMAWMATVSGARARLPAGAWDELAHLLAMLDQGLDQEGRKYIASGVQLAVRRPGAG